MIKQISSHLSNINFLYSEKTKKKKKAHHSDDKHHHSAKTIQHNHNNVQSIGKGLKTLGIG